LSTLVRTFFLVALIAASSLRAEEPERPGEAVRTIVSRETEFFEFARDHSRRAAFLEFLGDDAVMFDPGPVNAKQMWTKRPDDNSSLIWQAEFAAVARACDIGYDTGPWEFKKDKAAEKADAFGHFVSIWRKQRDGRWKVAIDYGVEHPQPLGDPRPAEMLSSDDGLNEPVDTKTARKAARGARDAFLKAAANDSAAALLAAADDNIRVYRQGVFPATGREAAGVMLGTTTGKLKLESSGGGISRTGDLGYDYGSYNFKRGEANERGYYLQIWHTDGSGAWKLALDLQRKLPDKR
jgi:ketosteroid isomerase-like protein